MNLNDRQIKALKALKHNSSYISQYSNSAAWYVWNPDPVDDLEFMKSYKTRLNLTCRDVWKLGHLQLGLLGEPRLGNRYLTDEGRKYLEEIES
jgi:hypothetical protein